MQNLNSVALKIIQLREALNLTQEQLAQKANIPIDELKNIESANPNFHMVEFFKLSETLKFNPSKIFSDCDKSHKQRINNIKKILSSTTEENIIDFENYIKTKLKIK